MYGGLQSRLSGLGQSPDGLSDLEQSRFGLAYQA
jgi:hypothetical protein